MFYLILLQTIIVETKSMKSSQVVSQSCLDYFKKGYKSDGFYKIRDFNGNSIITVYCDLTSEPGSAWTLDKSFAFKNRRLNNLRGKAYNKTLQ